MAMSMQMQQAGQQPMGDLATMAAAMATPQGKKGPAAPGMSPGAKRPLDRATFVKQQQGVPKPMSMEDLPPRDTTRWVPRRKADVVAGVRCGLITLEEACRMYQLSLDEFRSWERLFERHGVRGLRTTRIKTYRTR